MSGLSMRHSSPATGRYRSALTRLSSTSSPGLVAMAFRLCSRDRQSELRGNFLLDELAIVADLMPELFGAMSKDWRELSA